MTRAKKRAACPRCGSRKIVPIVYGSPTPRIRTALQRGRAVLGAGEEWEGRPEWRCRECASEWRGRWVRFRRG